MKRFADKSVLVVGGSSGIGRASAVAYAREGATVGVWGRNVEALAETVRQVEKEGGAAFSFRVDITDPHEVEAVFEQTVRKLGGLDVAFNNAGVLAVAKVAEMSHEDWNRSISTNLTGIWHAMRSEITYMSSTGGGVIVNTASNIGAHMRLPGFGAYAATKAAVSVLSRTAALDYASDGVRVNSVSPGPVDTRMTYLPGESKEDRDARFATMNPSARVASLQEITSAVLWLSSEESTYVVGHDLVIDGGASA